VKTKKKKWEKLKKSNNKERSKQEGK